MKKTFLQFPAKTGTLPCITSRRRRIGSGRHNVAYKSDGDDPDALESKLTALKAALEGSITTKQKAAIDAAILGVQAKLDEKEALRVTMQAAIDESKATILVLKDAADKNQPIIDKFAAGEGKEVKGKAVYFNDFLKDGITEKADQIKSLKKGQGVEIKMDETKALGDMLFANSFPTADVSVTTLRPGIIELPKRKLHIRQLLSGGAMSNSNFAYVKETAGEGAIAPVAEGVLKPQIDLNLQEVSVPAQYIAGWLRISRKMLDDIPGMITFLQSRLPELLLRVEDNQLLNGDGVGSNLSGITDPGNFTSPAAPYIATLDVEQIVQAVSQLESFDREANGILLSPADYYNILLNKAAGGAGTYDLPTALATIQNGQLFIAGIPVFRSTAMAPDKYIVGDWVMGANLITREAPRVEIFYEDGINVRENMVTVRVEERIAFPIYGDNYFIFGDFGNLT
jgi:HK97 family phage major capsid protein